MNADSRTGPSVRSRRVSRPRARLALAVLACTAGAGAVGIQATLQGPGDPTTPYLSGLGNACRLAFDGTGNLHINDGGVLYRAAPGEDPALLTDQVPDPRGFAIDAFGDLLVASPLDSAIYRVSPQAEISRFADAYNVRALAVGHDGSVWATGVDTLHHFDAVGRLLEKIDIRSAGAAAFGMQISPSGELVFSNFAGLWKLVDGVPTALLTEQPLRNRGFAIDADGAIYWARDAMDDTDVDRIIRYDAAGQVVQDTMIADVVDPCLVIFVRDTDGDMTDRVLVAQSDGSIVEASATGIPAVGAPPPPSLDRIQESDCAEEAAGVERLSDDIARLLDALGNNNGGYDVGDFRAFLQATGVITTGGAS